MDQFGDILLSWSNGYSGSPLYFVDDKTICFVNGNCIKFVNINDGSVSYLHAPGNGISALAVNPFHGLVAFGENGLNAKIFIYETKKLDKPICTIPGSKASLGYKCIAFANNGTLLASCSNIPEVKLTLWNWPEEEEHCSYMLDKERFDKLIFNPLNWRQFACIAERTVLIWNIEKVNETFYLQKLKIKLPKTDGTFGLEFFEDDYSNSLTTRPTTGHNTLQLSKTAIAGLSGEEKERFLIANDKDRCIATSFCWQPNNHVLVACTSSKIISYDCETQNTTILENDDSNTAEKFQFTFNCIQLHKDGLFASTEQCEVFLLNLSKNGFKIKSKFALTQPLTDLKFSPDYKTMVCGGKFGSIYKYVGEELSPVIEDDSFGDIIGVDHVAATNQYTVVGRSEGLVSIVSTVDGKTIGKFDLKTKLSCLSCSPSSSSVFIGTAYGSLVVLDLTNPSTPRCVYEKMLHQGAVTFAKVDDSGSIMLTSSLDGHLFFFRPTLASNFEVLGHIAFNGEVLCISIKTFQNEVGAPFWKVLVGLSTSGHKPGCNQLVEMTVTPELLKGSTTLFLDDTRQLKDIALNKRVFVLKTSIYDIAVVTESTAIALIRHGHRVAKFNLSENQEAPTAPGNNIVLDASFTYPAHALPGGQIHLSCHGKWLVTASPDGHFITRAVGAMNNNVALNAADYRDGGLESVRFTPDAQQILAVSKTGVLSCWKWKYSALGKSKATVVIETYKSLLGEARGTRNKEDSILKESKEIVLDRNQPTWLTEAIEKSRKKEDEKYKSTKTILKKEMEQLRQQVLEMMRINQSLPDIEKLERFEFIMDTDERNAMLVEREKLLKELRAEAELKDTAKQYLWTLLKKECWDEMVVKGKHILGFQNKCDIVNYPMRQRSAEEIEELQYATQCLEIERIEKTSRVNALPSETAAYASLIEKPEDADEDLSESARALKNESAATYGSLAFNYGVHNDLLLSQFSLHTKNQKKFQIALLKDGIYKIKNNFNKVFEDVHNAKQQEIKRINERNTRIQKISNDLGLQETLVKVEVSPFEQPERMFVVEDHEVTVEKYISEEERQRLEELARLEEERRLSENADNLRGRALDMMMAGRLETGIEDELKKDIEVPDFMEKPQEKWSEDEQKQAKEYERKRTQLAEGREKYMKSLEMELRKLQTANTDATNHFDERLNQLFIKKIKTEAVILQEELKIVRLAASILFDEELESGEVELHNNLERKKEEKQKSSLSVGDARRAVEQFKDNYETLIADDRTLDKLFRKEFNELDTHTVDVLYRLFKKRPRAQRTLKAAMEHQNESSTNMSSTEKGNPFQLRPSSSHATSTAAASMEKALADLDNEQHMPENVDVETWHHLVALRRNKIEKEQQLKSNALVMADMNAFLQKKIDGDEELKYQVEKSFEEMQRLRDERLRFNLNLQAQLLLKQGQIEVGRCAFVPNYTDSLLIHRSAVEDLNTVIKTLGEAKLASMNESKDFRKGIHMLAWQLKEMFMRAEDFQSAAQDLQLLRVTKDLQVYLSETDQRKSKQQEIATLEKTIEAYKGMHDRKVGDKKRAIRKLKRQIRQKADENQKLDDDLEEMALDVAERTQINKSHDGEDKKKETNDQVMHNIILRRKLVDLAKSQASQVGVLRAEVERLRMRTFPALVQLDS